jgi:AcrR family transcriptional regulator
MPTLRASIGTMTTPMYQRGNLREELLRLAEERIEVVGPEGLSLRELARELGVSHAAPAKHFPDKQALLDALLIRGLEQLGGALQEVMGHPFDTFAEGLNAFAWAYTTFAAKHPILIGLALARKSKAESPALLEATRRTFHAVEQLIDRAQQTGAIVDDDELVQMPVLAMLQGLTAMTAQGMLVDRDPRKVVADCVTTLITGLQPR